MTNLSRFYLPTIFILVEWLCKASNLPVFYSCQKYFGQKPTSFIKLCYVYRQKDRQMDSHCHLFGFFIPLCPEFSFTFVHLSTGYLHNVQYTQYFTVHTSFHSLILACYHHIIMVQYYNRERETTCKQQKFWMWTFWWIAIFWHSIITIVPWSFVLPTAHNIMLYCYSHYVWIILAPHMLLP